MRNGFQKVDVASASAFATVAIGFAADELTLINNSGVIVEVSTDGTNIDIGELPAASGTQMVLDRTHVLYNKGAQAGISTIYLRRQTGTGGGPLYVAVYAERY